MAAMHDWRDLDGTRLQRSPFRAVITYLDGTDAAHDALAVAKILAEAEAATLHIAFLGADPMEAKKAVDALNLTAKELRGVVFDHVEGAPFEGLKNAALRLPESLIVMATRSENDAEDVLGSMAEAMLNDAPECVLMVPPGQGSAWRLRRVVIAHDGTRSADHAIPTAAALAHHAGAEVIALHVAARSAEESVEPGSMPAPRYIDQPQHEWPAWAGEFLERMLAVGNSPSAINFKLLVTGGQPGSEIAQFARDHQADLVVLPWHGKWQEQQSGAVDVVVRRSGCPVLLICTA